LRGRDGRANGDHKKGKPQRTLRSQRKLFSAFSAVSAVKRTHGQGTDPRGLA
jgi:hypothetical protein